MVNVEDLDDRTFQLLFGVGRSGRYHNRRRQFYEGLHSLNQCTAAVALATGSALSFVGSATPLFAALAAGVAAWCLVDTVHGTARRANAHAVLAAEFANLEKRFSRGGNLTDDEYEAITNARLDIESREPPTLTLLNELCHYDLRRALGVMKPPPPIPFWRRWLANWASQGSYTVTLGDA